MKNLKLMLLILSVMLCFGMGNLIAQESFSKTVIVRVLEGSYSVKPGLVTIDAEGKTSIIELEKSDNTKVSSINMVTIKQELDKWKQAGYKITHVSTTGEMVFRTTYILEK